MSTVLGLPVVLIDRGSPRPPEPHRLFAEGGRGEWKAPPEPPARSDGIPGSPVLGCWHGLLKHGLGRRAGEPGGVAEACPSGGLSRARRRSARPPRAAAWRGAWWSPGWPST